MKKTLINIGERAVSTFLFSYGSAAAVLAGGFGTKHDLQIAGSAAVLSLVKNVTAFFAADGNGPDAVGPLPVQVVPIPEPAPDPAPEPLVLPPGDTGGLVT